jgi:sugar-specific transcriptional regulator TrmB
LNEVIETLLDPDEILKLGLELLSSAKEEVLIIFSTANAFFSSVERRIVGTISRTV